MANFDPAADLRAQLSGTATEPDIAGPTAQPAFDPAQDLRDTLKTSRDREREAEAQRAVHTVMSTPEADTETVRIADGLTQNGQPITPEIVGTDKPRFAQELEAMQVYKVLTDAPLTAQWFASAENAQYARRDVERLASIERMFADPGALAKTAGGVLSVPRMIPPVLGGALQGTATGVETVERSAYAAAGELADRAIERAQAAGEGSDPLALVREASRLRHAAFITGVTELRTLADALENGDDPTEVRAAIEQAYGDVVPSPERDMYKVGTWVASRLQETLAPPVGTEESLPVLFGQSMGSLVAFMAVSAVTGPVGSFSMAAALGIDEAYDRGIAYGLTHEDAMEYAAAGAPAGAIQALSIEFLMRRLPIPAARRASVVVKDLAMTGAAEATVETLGLIMQNVNQQRYDAAKGTFDDTAIQGVLSGSAAATLRGLMLTLAPGARRSLFRDIERMETSDQLQKTFEALGQGLEGSALREAVPEKFRSWAQSITTGTQMENVYVSVEGLQELAQSIQDPAMLARIIEVLPGVDQAAFDAALRDGTDLVIPMATWMTDVIGTDVDTTLVPHIRFDPTGMTTFERLANATKINNEVLELRKRIDALEGTGTMADLTPEESARLEVFETARSAIAEAGYADSAADAYAAQYAAFFARTAERAEMPIDQFLQRFPLANINIDGTMVSMQRAPVGDQSVQEMMAAVRDEGNVDPTVVQARNALAALGVDMTDMADMTDQQMLDALQADATLEQQSAATAPGSRALGRLLSSTTLGRGALPFTPITEGRGPSIAARPARIDRGGAQVLNQSVEQGTAAIRPEVVFGTELEGDGLKFAGFFADVTEGTRQRPTKLVAGEVEYQGAITLTPEVAEFQATREKYTGNFDQHIQTSIPGFYEIQAIVGDALAKAYNRAGVYMLDIGASEGALMKAVAERSEGSIFATALDPNPAMRDTFERMGGPKQVSFELAAFGSRDQEGQEAWTEDHKGETVSVPFYKPTGPKFDVVHEAMVFQFISNGRGAQVARVKELMRPDGIAIFEQKFGGPADQYNASEAKKDEYKAQYYTADQLEAKRAEVLQTGGDAVEGMTDLQVSQAEFEAVLRLHFKHVFQFWSSGNFKGYIAGDSLAEVRRVLDNMQSTQSEYSVEATPREVTVAVYASTQTVSTPETTGAPPAVADIGNPTAEMLTQPGWAVVSGMTIGSTDTAGSDRLRARLDEMGLEYQPVTGRYMGEDQGLSFLIQTDEATAIALGREFGQESIITSKGLVYPAGRSNTPATGTTFEGDAARAQDGFFETDGGVALSLDLDWAAPVFAPNRPQLPLTDDGLVEMHHWSDNRLSTVDPKFAGTGPYKWRVRRLSFFGLNVRASRSDPGTGYVKENGLGPYHHVARVDPARLYPWFEDPDGIKVKVKAKRAEYEAPSPTGRSMATSAMDVEWYEQMIREAGYLGYYTTDDGSGSAPLGNVAVVFGAVDVDVVADDDTGQVLYQSETDGGWYYSALTAAVRDAKQKQATAKDWKAIITKLPGVKKAEIEWSGVLEWLDTREGQITRERVAQYLQNSELDLVELTGTATGGEGDGAFVAGEEMIPPDEYWITEEAENYIDDGITNVIGYRAPRMAIRLEHDAIEAGVAESSDEIEAVLLRILPDMVDGRSVIADDPLDLWVIKRIEEDSVIEGIKERAQEGAEQTARDTYAAYSAEYEIEIGLGDGDYRTATRDSDGNYYFEGDEYRSLDGVLDAANAMGNDGTEGSFRAKWSQYTEKGDKKNYREVLLTIPDLEAVGLNEARDHAQPFEYDSHYDAVNVVVTARLTDRASVHGGATDTLFAEEVQSDLASEWRKAGGQSQYADSDARSAALDAFEAAKVNEAEATDRFKQIETALADRLLDAELPRTLGAISVATSSLNNDFSVAATSQRMYGDNPTEEQQRKVEDAGQIVDAAAADPALASLLRDYTEAGNRQGYAADQRRAARYAIDELDGPDTPFTPFEDTISYEVMLKRLLNMAATEGYSNFAWTPAYMQARRWSGKVHNVVRQVDWSSETGEGSGALDAPTTLADARLRVEAALDPRAQILTRPLPDDVSAAELIDDYLGRLESAAEIEGGPFFEFGSLSMLHANQLRDLELGIPDTMRALRRLSLEEQGLSVPASVGAPVQRKVILDGETGADTFYIDENGVIIRKTSGRIPASEYEGTNIAVLIGGPLTKTILSESEGGQPVNNIIIGGDGYKIAYDQTMKKFVEKFAKKYGGKLTIRDDLPAFAHTSGITGLVEAAAQLGFSDVLAKLEAALRGPAFWTNFYDRLTDARKTERATAMRVIEANEAEIARLDAAIGELSEPGGPDDSARMLLTHDMRRLVEMTNSRRELVRTLDDPEAFKATAVKNLIEGGYITPTQMREAVPELPAAKGDAVWFVEITPAMREAATQPQPLFQNNRGSIVLPPRNQAPTINLFAQKDMSTLLHEMGHQYLYILQQLAEDNVESGGLGTDWQTINNWWKQNADAVAVDASKTGTHVTPEQVREYLARRSTGDGEVDRAISVGLQEQWARGFEKYLFEGRSPTLSLRATFQKFKAWLMHTYKQATRLNVNVSTEMTDVFDRLFASEAELALAREDQGMGMLSAADAESMGVDAASYDALLRLQAEAVAEQEERLLRDIMAPIRQQKTAEYKAARAAIEAKVRADMTARREHRLREWLGNGRWLGGEAPDGLPAEMRMDRAELVERLGDEDRLRLIPRGARPLYSRKGEQGLPLEEVANWFGFTSADQMLTTLQGMPKLEDAIAAETDKQAKATLVDPMTDDTIPQVAIDALHGDKASQLLIAEMRALSKAGGVKGKVTPRAQAREVARRTLAGMPVRDAIRSGLYQAAERKAALEAQEALAKGDRQTAFNAKQRQLVNHMLYSESRKVVELVTKVENLTGRLKRKGTRQNLDGGYIEAIDEILATYEFRRVSNRQIERRGALAAYVQRMKDAGRENELAIPSDVLEQSERVNYKQLAVSHLEGVYDTLVNIAHTARWKKKLTDAKEKREFDEIIDEVLASFAENVDARARNRVATDADRRRSGVKQYLNLILTATTLLRKIDGGRSGAAVRNIKARIDAATRDVSMRNEQLAERLEQLYAPYSQTEMRRMSVKKRYDAVNADLSRWDIISIALNMGNVDNLERLTDPASRGFTRAQVDKLIDELDQRDWQYVQGMWDLINSYWAEIAAREKRITGVVPKKVEAVPLQTKFGLLQGGYYPIMYDGELSAQVTDEQTAETMQNVMPGKFGKAQTAAGHLETRAKGSGGRALMLGVEVAHRHLGRVTHDLAYSEAVTSSWRILQDSRLRAAFQNAGMLDDLRTLELWVQDVATGQMAASDVVSRVARRVKSNFTLAKLGFNISTVLVQLTGIAQSVVVVGKKEFAMATMQYAKSPRGVAREVKALSDLMRRRETTFNKDVNDILGDITRGPAEGTYQYTMRKVMGPMAFFLMQKVQYYGVDLPTWVAAYNSGQSGGMTQAEAIAFADETVIRAQAGGDFADRSAFERGTLNTNTRQSDLVRLFTTLGSYMFAKANVAYERTGRARRVIREEGVSVKSASEVLSYATDMALLIALESVMYAAIMGRLPDNEDDDSEGWLAFLARETALGTMAMMPFVRDVAGPLQGFSAGGAYGGITETLSEPILRGFAAADSGEVNLGAIKSAVNVIGLSTGLPSTATNRIIDGFWRESEGTDVAPIEFLMGRR